MAAHHKWQSRLTCNPQKQKDINMHIAVRKRGTILGEAVLRWLPILLGLFFCWGITSCKSVELGRVDSSPDVGTSRTIQPPERPPVERGVIYVKTHDGESIPLYENSYALVIGNGNYTNGWDVLNGALADVDDVAKALKANGFTVELKKNLTKSEFDKVLGNFIARYGSGKDNRNQLLFYYAGHGNTEQMANNEQLGYLVMVDAPDPVIDLEGFRGKSIDMESLITKAKLIQSKHVLFMFDSCFSGTILNMRDKVTPANITNSVKYPVRQFITAGRANEPVPDHSVFKQAFLDLLEGREPEPIPDGYITGEELGLYLKSKVPQYYESQNPQYGKIRNPELDKGDFVFVLKNPKLPPDSKHVTEKSVTLNKSLNKFLSICNHNIDNNFDSNETISCDFGTLITGRTKNIPSNMYLWLLVHPTGTGGYWPQVAAIRPHPITNTWEQKAWLGTAGSTLGERFELSLVLVNEAGDKIYQQYLSSGNNSEIPIPSGSSEIDRVTVIKASHDECFVPPETIQFIGRNGKKLHIFEDNQGPINAGIPIGSDIYIIMDQRPDPIVNETVALPDGIQNIEQLTFKLSYEYHADSFNDSASLEFVIKDEHDNQLWLGTRNFLPKEGETKKRINDEFIFNINRKYQGKQITIQVKPISSGDFGFYIYNLEGVVATKAKCPI